MSYDQLVQEIIENPRSAPMLLHGMTASQRAMVAAEIMIVWQRERVRAPLHEGARGVGTVYLVGGANRLKIGFTMGAPKTRIAELQVGSPVSLVLIDCYRGTRDDEHDLHDEFRRFHSHGEWFEDRVEIAALFRKIASDPTRASRYRPEVC